MFSFKQNHILCLGEAKMPLSKSHQGEEGRRGGGEEERTEEREREKEVVKRGRRGREGQ